MKNENEKTRRFFNRVAFIYPIIDYNLMPEYRRALRKLKLPESLTVLDLATGTGILAGAFSERGHKVSGLDFAEKLMNRARKKFPAVEFRHFDLTHLDRIEDTSYDIVSMGYLLHGVDPQFRHHILKHARRICREFVIVFDYCCPGNRLVRFIEWLEGPYYPQFVRDDRAEDFAAGGLTVEREIHLSDYGNVWLCKKHS